VNSHQVEPTEPVFELAAPEQVDVTPEIDEIGELLGHTKHFNDAIDRDAWTHGYPYAEKMTRKEYERTKRKLQIELLKLQAWVKETGQKVVILLKGAMRRARAGRSSA
jgi:polyphosphate kinase 2 (PPK2 family)